MVLSRFFRSYRRRRKPRRLNPHFQTHKAEARALILELLAELTEIYPFEYNQVRIKDQRTRWGSCSSKRNLNFNYRLLFLTREQARYVVAHELCHLEEMNHSEDFWALVKQAVPNYKELRKQMRTVKLLHVN